MTVVLKPSEIAQRDFMPEDRAGALVSDIEKAVDDMADGCLVIGNAYTLGGDVDVVLYFDERDADDGIEAHRAVRDVCMDYRLRHCDIISIAQNGAKLDGMENIRGVSPLMHIIAKMNERKIFSGNFRLAMEQALAGRDGKGIDAMRGDAIAYGSHKHVSLMKHAAPVFDLEDDDCVKGLGKILSFAPHMLAKLWRLHESGEPPAKKELHEWARRMAKREGSSWYGLAAVLVEKGQEYRALLRTAVDARSTPRDYVDFLSSVRERDATRAVELARGVPGVVR